MSEHKTSGRRRWIWMLGASIGLNIFAAGFLVSRCSRSHRAGPPLHVDPSRDTPLLFHAREAFGGEIPEDARAALRTQVTIVRQQRQELRRAHEGVRSALEAENFDSEALSEALSQVRSSTSKMQGALHGGLVQLAQSATNEQRKRLAQANIGRHQRGAGKGSSDKRKREYLKAKDRKRAARDREQRGPKGGETPEPSP
ncbi:MAG: hypothetical protein RJA70_1366 [Pseudomonadota bacterium]